MNFYKGVAFMHNVFVDLARCKRCGICIEFCPVQLFDTGIEAAPIPARLKNCTACMLCELRCPELAIKVEVNKVEK